MFCTLKYGATQILDLITSSNQLYAVEMVMDWKKMKFVLTLIITSEYILNQKRFNPFWFQDYHQRKICSILFKPEKVCFVNTKSSTPRQSLRNLIMRDPIHFVRFMRILTLLRILFSFLEIWIQEATRTFFIKLYIGPMSEQLGRSRQNLP